MIISGSAPRLIEDSAMKLSALKSQWTVRTIAVLPLSVDVPTERFARLLHNSIVNTGIESERSIITLTSGAVLTSLHGLVFNNAGRARLADYLTALEGRVNVTLFIAEHSADSEWTRVCVERVSPVLSMLCRF